MHWLAVLVVVLHVSQIHMRDRKPPKYKEERVSAVIDNPNFIRDRFYNIFKPPMPPSFKERFLRPYTPSWMDFCDPYHCNAYHRPACGINREKRVFKWFQSGCHIILNNECASFRGNLNYCGIIKVNVSEYDRINPRACDAFINHGRSGCACEPGGPLVCSVSLIDNQVALFRDACALQQANCDAHSFDEYEEVDMGLCTYYLKEEEE